MLWGGRTMQTVLHGRLSSPSTVKNTGGSCARPKHLGSVVAIIVLVLRFVQEVTLFYVAPNAHGPPHLWGTGRGVWAWPKCRGWRGGARWRRRGSSQSTLCTDCSAPGSARPRRSGKTAGGRFRESDNRTRRGEGNDTRATVGGRRGDERRPGQES